MAQPEASDMPKGIFNNTKIHAFVICHFCEKTWCLYSIAVLTFEQKDQINIYIDQIRYSCEECLFLQDHSLGGLLFTKQALTCNSPIEVEYYSRRLQKDQLCYYCELKEFLIDIDDDILENYQSVYPLCSNCKIGGRKIHTWGKKKIPGISNKRQKLN